MSLLKLDIYIFIKEELLLVKFHSVAGKEEKDEVSLLELGRWAEGRWCLSRFTSMTFEETCPLCLNATTAAFPCHVLCTPPCMTNHCTHVPTHLIANLQTNMHEWPQSGCNARHVGMQ